MTLSLLYRNKSSLTSSLGTTTQINPKQLANDTRIITTSQADISAMAPQSIWTNEEDNLLLSLLHRDLYENDYTARRPWRDVAQDMTVEGARLELGDRLYSADSVYSHFKFYLRARYHEERRAILEASASQAVNIESVEVNNSQEDSQVNFADFLIFEEDMVAKPLIVQQTHPTT